MSSEKRGVDISPTDLLHAEADAAVQEGRLERVHDELHALVLSVVERQRHLHHHHTGTAPRPS